MVISHSWKIWLRLTRKGSLFKICVILRLHICENNVTLHWRCQDNPHRYFWTIGWYVQIKNLRDQFEQVTWYIGQRKTLTARTKWIAYVGSVDVCHHRGIILCQMDTTHWSPHTSDNWDNYKKIWVRNLIIKRFLLGINKYCHSVWDAWYVSHETDLPSSSNLKTSSFL